VCFRALFVSRAEVRTLDGDDESLAELKDSETRLKELYVWSRRRGWAWQAVVTVFGLGGGILAATIGSLLSAVAWMRGEETGGLSLHGVGSVLLLSTIPLLILGAHCLDLLDKRVETSQEVAADGEGSAAVRGSRARSGAAVAVILLMLLCGPGSKTRAQQTIFNVPTTDVLERGKVYAELDASFKPNDSEAAPRFSSFVPRVLTAGGYDFTRNVVAPANRAGGQFGFEQPAGRRLTLAADWFTGRHAAGYFTPGAVFKLNPKLTGYAGYSLGNSNLTRGNHFFLLELGYNFD
jgi:hypothetical protein